MKFSTILAGLHLVAIALAGGYQGALERVVLYYAYQIDGLNDPKAQRIGFVCPAGKLDSNGDCSEWREFQCHNGPNGRCNFNQFFRGMGGVNGNSQIVPGDNQNALTVDIEKTAVNYYNWVRENTVYKDKDTGFQEKGRVSNYQATRVMKYASNNYNEFLEDLGDHIRNTAKDRKKPGNAWMFDEFTKTVSMIKEARAGDHGPHAIKEAKKRLGAQWVFTRNVGSNPALNPAYKNVDWFEGTKDVWSEMDWVATENKMRKGGDKKAGEKVAAARQQIYPDGEGEDAENAARQHLNVIESFGNMERKVRECK